MKKFSFKQRVTQHCFDVKWHEAVISAM